MIGKRNLNNFGLLHVLDDRCISVFILRVSKQEVVNQLAFNKTIKSTGNSKIDITTIIFTHFSLINYLES